MSKHTPMPYEIPELPWVTRCNTMRDDDSVFVETARRVPKKVQAMADALAGRWSEQAAETVLRIGVPRLLGEMIVRACNAHDDLIAALKDIACGPHGETNCSAKGCCADNPYCDMMIACAALAKAKPNNLPETP